MLLTLLRELLARMARDHARQFARFAAVGACNTVLDFGMYVALTRSMPWWRAHIVVAAAASFCLAALSSFLLNTFWTFAKSGVGWQARFPKFMTVALGGLAWNAVILTALTAAGLHDIMAKLMATGAVMCWNFALQKNWTFRA